MMHGQKNIKFCLYDYQQWYILEFRNVTDFVVYNKHCSRAERKFKN